MVAREIDGIENVVIDRHAISGRTAVGHDARGAVEFESFQRAGNDAMLDSKRKG
jgi:hypothetical protein